MPPKKVGRKRKDHNPSAENAEPPKVEPRARTRAALAAEQADSQSRARRSSPLRQTQNQTRGFVITEEAANLLYDQLVAKNKGPPQDKDGAIITREQYRSHLINEVSKRLAISTENGEQKLPHPRAQNLSNDTDTSSSEISDRTKTKLSKTALDSTTTSIGSDDVTSSMPPTIDDDIYDSTPMSGSMVEELHLDEPQSKVSDLLQEMVSSCDVTPTAEPIVEVAHIDMNATSPKAIAEVSRVDEDRFEAKDLSQEKEENYAGALDAVQKVEAVCKACCDHNALTNLMSSELSELYIFTMEKKDEELKKLREDLLQSQSQVVELQTVASARNNESPSSSPLGSELEERGKALKKLYKEKFELQTQVFMLENDVVDAKTDLFKQKTEHLAQIAENEKEHTANVEQLQKENSSKILELKVIAEKVTQDLQAYKSQLDEINQLANHQGEEVARLATENATKTSTISTLQIENRTLRIQNLDIGRLQSDNASLREGQEKLQESIKEATNKCEKTEEELARVNSSNEDQLKKLQDALADMENRARAAEEERDGLAAKAEAEAAAADARMSEMTENMIEKCMTKVLNDSLPHMVGAKRKNSDATFMGHYLVRRLLETETKLKKLQIEKDMLGREKEAVDRKNQRRIDDLGSQLREANRHYEHCNSCDYKDNWDNLTKEMEKKDGTIRYIDMQNRRLREDVARLTEEKGNLQAMINLLEKKPDTHGNKQLYLLLKEYHEDLQKEEK